MRTKANEDLSYENAINCGMALTAGILSCCILEVVTYFLYLHEVGSAEFIIEFINYMQKNIFSFILGDIS